LVLSFSEPISVTRKIVFFYIKLLENHDTRVNLFLAQSSSSGCRADSIALCDLVIRKPDTSRAPGSAHAFTLMILPVVSTLMFSRSYQTLMFSRYSCSRFLYSPGNLGIPDRSLRETSVYQRVIPLFRLLPRQYRFP